MNIVEEVIKRYGGVPAVQERFGYSSPMAVYNWRSRGIPKDKLIDVHMDTGVELWRLRKTKSPEAAA